MEKYNTDMATQGGKVYVQWYIQKAEDWDRHPDESGKTSQPLVIALCTPLMFCAHKYVTQPSELVYSTAS